MSAAFDPKAFAADAVPHMLWVADAAGAPSYQNRCFNEYVGEDTLADDWGRFIHPDDLPGLVAVWTAAVAAGRPFEAEYRFRRHDGAYRWQIGCGAPHVGPGGAVWWYGSLTDIDDRVQADRKLRQRDRAIGAVPLGILITDADRPDHPIVYASPGFERMTGYPAAETLGRNCRFLQGPDTDREAVGRLRAAIRAGEALSIELLNHKRDGTPFWNELSVTPVCDDAGRLTHFVGVQADISARRTLEQQFRQAQKMEAVGLLAAGVAHDFNNLLTVIAGYSKLFLEQSPADGPWRGPVGEIYHAGRRAADLTRQLLAFSRTSAPELRVVDPNAVVRDAGTLLARLIGAAVETAVELDPHAGCVKTDPGQLEQALVNLCVNARDAMPAGGRLTISTRDVEVDGERPDAAPGPYVAVRVADTGEGMDAETQRRIFEPFFTTKGEGKGTGLGLAMVYAFARQSGGFVEVVSEPGKGAAFDVFLPRVDEVARTDPDSGLFAPVQPPPGTGTVLLVEDEPSVRALTGHVLTGCGYTVLEAEDGPQAVALASAHGGPIHLVLSDLMMPGGMAGHEVVEAVRRSHPRAKALYVSGYSGEAAPRGAEFLAKPFTPAGLAARVRQVLAG